MLSTTDVLICGAGPAGLTAALSISHHCPGTSITIVDALEKDQNQSRAMTIHAGTIESLGTLGCADTFLEEGLPVGQLHFQNQNGTLFRPNFTLLSKLTKYPTALIIIQSHTERILNRLLKERGIYVERPVRAIGVEELVDAPDHFNLRVNFDNGNSIRTRYLIGADGSKSTIREYAKIPCADPDPGYNPLLRMVDSNPWTAGVADVKFDPSTPPEILPETVTGIFGPDGFLFLCPFKDTAYSEKDESGTVPISYRVAYFIEEGEKLEDRSKYLEVDYVQRKIDHTFTHHASGVPKSITPKVSQVMWSNTFRIRNAVADTFFKALPNGGKIILVGDAAHVHSPVGGQGMNMGMSDAAVLGAALAQHLASDDDSILQRFSDERRGVAIEVVNATKMGTFMTTIRHPVARFLRDTLLRGLSSIPFIARSMAWRNSGLIFRERSSFTY